MSSQPMQVLQVAGWTRLGLHIFIIASQRGLGNAVCNRMEAERMVINAWLHSRPPSQPYLLKAILNPKP